MGAFGEFIGRTLARAIVPHVKNSNIINLADMSDLAEWWGAETSAGNRISAKNALQVTVALACTRAIAEGIAQVPLRLMKRRADGGADLATEHPLFALMGSKPNDWQTSFEFFETGTTHAVLTGGGYAFKAWTTRGKLSELIPLVPGNVTVRQHPDYSLTYTVSDGHGKVGEFGPDHILHLRGPSWDSVVGWDVSRLARNAIGLAAATEESQAKVHANGGRVAGIISFEQAITPEVMNRVRDAWVANYGGSKNAGKTALLDNNAKYTPMAQSFMELQTLEARKFQVEEVCRAFMVYPAIIGHADKASTFASAEQFFQAHIRHTLQPWARRWEQKLDGDLLADVDRAAGYFFRFDLDALMRGDMAARGNYYQKGITAGWLTRNEARKAEGLNPIDGLDEPLVPLNMVNGTAPPPADDGNEGDPGKDSQK